MHNKGVITRIKGVIMRNKGVLTQRERKRNNKKEGRNNANEMGVTLPKNIITRMKGVLTWPKNVMTRIKGVITQKKGVLMKIKDVIKYQTKYVLILIWYYWMCAKCNIDLYPFPFHTLYPSIKIIPQQISAPGPSSTLDYPWGFGVWQCNVENIFVVFMRENTKWKYIN